MGAYIELAAPVRAEDPMDDVAAVWERDWLVGERALSPNTVAAYTADVRDFMAFLSSIGIESFSVATTADISAWVGALAQRRLSPSSFRARVCALRDLYRYLGAYGLADEGSLPYIDVPRKRESEERPLDGAQEAAVWATYDIDTPSHERDRAEFALMDDLGLRASEIVELDVDDLRAEDHDLWVHGKGGKARLLPIEDDTLSVVEHYMECARPHLKCANRRQDATALFLNTRGGRITRQAVWQSVSRHGKAAGVAYLHPHQLRRTFASQMYRRNMDLRTIQEMLGHADLETTGLYITPEAADIHERYDAALRAFWESSAEKEERAAELSETEDQRRYWLNSARISRERARFEQGGTRD